MKLLGRLFGGKAGYESGGMILIRGSFGENSLEDEISCSKISATTASSNIILVTNKMPYENFSMSISCGLVSISLV